MSRYAHYCHLRDTPLVKVGQYVKRGDVIGVRGSTGNSTANHLHFEIHKNKPSSWYFYPVGYTRLATQALYQDPTPFCAMGIPCTYDRIGFHFLQLEQQGIPKPVFHPGIDLVGLAGTPIKSVFNGRVQFAEGTHWLKNLLGKWFPSMYNHGFGNHVYIEVDESDPGI